MEFNTDPIFGNWRLFIFSTLGCLLLATLYTSWYEAPYEASLVLPLTGDNQKSISQDTKIQLVQSLTSTHMIERAVKDLGLQLSYYEQGSLSGKELYGEESPVKLRLQDSSVGLNSRLAVHIVNDSYFDIFYEGRDYVYQYGQFIIVSGVKFSIVKNTGFTGKEERIFIQFENRNTLIRRIRAAMAVMPGSKDTSTLLLSLQGSHPRKLYDLALEISKLYTEDWQKNSSAQRVLMNIDSQINRVTTDLLMLRKRLSAKPADFHLKTELQAKVNLYFYLMQKREDIKAMHRIPEASNDKSGIIVVHVKNRLILFLVLALLIGLILPLPYIYRKM